MGEKVLDGVERMARICHSINLHLGVDGESLFASSVRYGQSRSGLDPSFRIPDLCQTYA